ncbi:DUF2306 domain-containing protein [Kordiimonas aquimaris]|uniref:DUF2306 domain-containing protein n=1 Tax=Kordiimonas aquimaris TaxID=707591 RepID=UPI0021D02380|nr:DUF2306 domain-containing protein [Kordiimonas aquimaris]
MATATQTFLNKETSTNHPVPPQPKPWPDRMVRYSGIAWFLAAAIGQWIFVFYVVLQYIPELVQFGLPGLANTTLPDGYIAGDMAGNLAIAAHVLIAIIIIGSGPLQFIPHIRNRFPRFHRYVGRVYIVMASITSIAGLYIVWTRGVPGGLVGHLAISLDAVLILAFGGLAINFATKRQIDRHRRWAMRLFMVVSAVWFFRIGLMFWFITTGGIGINPETFEGPFLTFMYFGQMAIPLLILEAYFLAQRSKNNALKSSVAVVLILATGAILVGTFAATMGMWFPRLI